MKTRLASWWAFLLLGAIAVPNNGAAKKPDGIWEDVQGIVKSCDDYEDREVTAEGAMTFLRPLLCEKPLVFNVYNDTVVSSRHTINTTNMHFVVHPKATLTMKARVISMGRDEASTQPVVKIFGKVHLDARSWTPSYANGSREDGDGVVRVFRGGEFDSSYPVRFSKSSFVVANEQARDAKEPLSKLSPHLEDLLTEFHARNETKTGTPNSNASSSTTTTTTTTDGLSSSRTTDNVSRSSSSSSSSSSDGDASGGTHIGRSGIEAARKTPSKFTLPQNLTLNHRVSQRIHELEAINLKRKTKSNDLSKLPRDSWNNHLIKNRAMLCPQDPFLRKLTCSLKVGQTLTGPLRSPGGRSVLWPGVDGSLMFGKFQMTPSTKDGDEGEGAGPGAMRSITLLRSDSQIVRNVMGMRRSKVRAFSGKGGNDSGKKMGTVGGWLPLVQRSEKNRTDGTGTAPDNVGSDSEIASRNVSGTQKTKVRDVDGEGNDDETGTKTGKAGGWLPWARRDEKNRFDEIGTATDKTGEVCASVSNKGCVKGTTVDDTAVVAHGLLRKVTVDGATVLSKSGPYAWDWLNRLPWTRPTDDGYEVHVTDDGMEVRLEERTVWGIKAEEWMG